MTIDAFDLILLFVYCFYQLCDLLSIVLNHGINTVHLVLAKELEFL